MLKKTFGYFRLEKYPRYLACPHLSVVLQVFPPHMFGSGRKGANETPVEGVLENGYTGSTGLVWLGLGRFGSCRVLILANTQ